MKKLVSTLLALSIILGTLFTGMSVAVSAATFAPVVKEYPQPEERAYPMSEYDCIPNYRGYGNHLPAYDKASIVKEGVDGSYALKIEGEGKEVQSVIKIGTATKALVSGTEYTLEMKMKRNIDFDAEDYGDITPYVGMGVTFSAGSDSLMDYMFFSETGEYETFQYTFTPEIAEDTDYWCHILLDYCLPEGVELCIDDINIFTTDAPDVNLFNLKRETLGSNLGSFDWMVTTPVEDEIIDGSVYTVNPLTTYGITADYVSIAEDKGVKGSAAMKIGPTSGKKNFFWQFAVEGTKYGGDTSDSFYEGKTVRVAFTAKKVGTVSDFSAKFYKSGSWKTHVMIATELTDDWVRYETDITFTSYDMYLNGSNYRGGHNRLVFESNVAADSCIYIDNIEVYAEVDNFTTNGCTLGGFDTFLYANNPATETVYEGVTYEPYNMSTYAMTDEFTDSGWGGTRTVEEGQVVISESGEGVNGSYALKLNGAGDAKEFAISLGKETFKPNTKYMVKMKTKASANGAVTQFNAGISRRWQWISNRWAGWGLQLENAEGLSDFTTNWNELTFFATTNEDAIGNFRRLHLLIGVAEGETLYLDDIEIYEVGGDGVNLFPQGTFGRISGVEAIDAGDEVGLSTPKYVDNGTVGINTDGFEAKAFPTSLALSGKHVFAAGFNANNAINGRVIFENTAIDTGKTYKVKFSALLVGEVTNFTVNMKDGNAAANEDGTIVPTVTLLNRKSVITTGAGTGKIEKNLASENWQDYEFIFTDEYTGLNGFTWPFLCIYVKAEIGAGVLLDNVSITEVDGTDDDKPNLFNDAGFEKEKVAEADFSSTKFWSGNDASDMTFMDNTDKTIGFYNTSYKENSDIFKNVVAENTEFSYGKTIIIDTSNMSLARYEAEQAVAAGKEIWIGLNSRISSNNAVVADYQDKIKDIANLVQGIAGDAFQGFYFDEPHYNFESNEKFAEVTKYLRETYKKRVFAMLKHDSFTTTTAKVTVTEDAFKYVTDIGYWNYSISGMQNRVNMFAENALPNINENARVWIAPLMGTHVTKDSEGNITENIDTEEETMQIFNTMLAGVKSDARFGGIMLYSLTDSNGYNLHKFNEEGVAEYNNFRNLLVAIADEFAGEGVLAGDLNEDGVLITDGNVVIGDYAKIDVYTANSAVVVLDGEEDLGVEAMLDKTGLTVKISALTSDAVKEVKIAVVGDPNGDGVSDMRDLVRMKKLAVDVDAPACELAAAGTTKAVGVQATHLSAFRATLIG